MSILWPLFGHFCGHFVTTTGILHIISTHEDHEKEQAFNNAR